MIQKFRNDLVWNEKWFKRDETVKIKMPIDTRHLYNLVQQILYLNTNTKNESLHK